MCVDTAKQMDLKAKANTQGDQSDCAAFQKQVIELDCTPPLPTADPTAELKEERSSYLVELLLVATVQEQKERARKRTPQRGTSWSLCSLRGSLQLAQCRCFRWEERHMSRVTPWRRWVYNWGILGAFRGLWSLLGPLWMHVNLVFNAS